MMQFSPRSRPLRDCPLTPVRLIATDMDGTLTQQGKFSPALLQALSTLAAAEIPVVIVTGRSAGWVQAIVHYLPIAGAIAENGGLFYAGEGQGDRSQQVLPAGFPEFLVPIADLADHRQKLANMFHQLQAEFPTIQESSDNQFRLTDWTFDVQDLTPAVLQQMGDRCQSQHWSFTYSTVQCHIKPIGQEKAIGLCQVLSQYFPQYLPHEMVTIGDSPNDESLFDPARFPLSVGVANVLHYCDQLLHQPGYVTNSAEAAGFCELVNAVLNAGV